MALEAAEEGEEATEPKTAIRVLEKTTTVNRALYVGARMPIAMAGDGVPEGGEVRFFGYSKAEKAWNIELPGFAAFISATDDRYIEIEAFDAAKSRKNVKAKVLPEGMSDWDAEAVETTNAFELKVVTKYPKVTLQAKELNLAFPEQGALVYGRSTAGIPTITGINITKPADEGKLIFDEETGEVSINTELVSAKCTIATTVDFTMPGYKRA